MKNWSEIELQYEEPVYSSLYEDYDCYARHLDIAQQRTSLHAPTPPLDSLVRRMRAMCEAVTVAINCLYERKLDEKWAQTDLARKEFIYHELLQATRRYLDGEDSFRYCGLSSGADRHACGAEAFYAAAIFLGYKPPTDEAACTPGAKPKDMPAFLTADPTNDAPTQRKDA